MHGLGDVRGAERGAVRRTGQVGDGARDFEDAMIGPRAEAELLHRALQQRRAVVAGYSTYNKR